MEIIDISIISMAEGQLALSLQPDRARAFCLRRKREQDPSSMEQDLLNVLLLYIGPRLRMGPF
jgi:hypothetical protein